MPYAIKLITYNCRTTSIHVDSQSMIVPSLYFVPCIFHLLKNIHFTTLHKDSKGSCEFESKGDFGESFCFFFTWGRCFNLRVKWFYILVLDDTSKLVLLLPVPEDLYANFGLKWTKYPLLFGPGKMRSTRFWRICLNYWFH